MQLNRPIQTRFRYGYVLIDLTVLHSRNSLTHYAKGTRSHFLAE